MAFDWRNARKSSVREMGWCLFSPPILDRLPPEATTPWPVACDRGAIEILEALDKDTAALETHLANGDDRRLGARFEAFWTFFLRNHPRYRLLAYNLPVYRNGNTLGALDFLFEDTHRERVVHGEVAVKFYIYQADRPGVELAKWIGPNPDDNLQLKIERLQRHQLPLSSGPEGMAALRAHGLPAPDCKAVLLKGYLFHPAGRTIDLPDGFNRDHLHGEWLTIDNLAELVATTNQEQAGTRWLILEKPGWLLPALPESQGVANFVQRVGKRLEREKRPIMIARTTDGEESRRYFVIPEGW
jgi:hypothetical protein